jgi:hypothetical protein
MNQATLDLLDASLRNDHLRYESSRYDDRVLFFTRHNIRIDPVWSERKYEELKKFNRYLEWRTIKYFDIVDPTRTEVGLDKIIDNNSKGVYIFYVMPKDTIQDMPKHVMYVGISGVRGSERSLRDRLKDYFYISKIKKRTNIHKFLQLYYKNVYIDYSFFNGEYNDLEKIEELLHEFFQPIYSIRDYEPETKEAKKAWNI